MKDMARHRRSMCTQQLMLATWNCDFFENTFGSIFGPIPTWNGKPTQTFGSEESRIFQFDGICSAQSCKRPETSNRGQFFSASRKCVQQARDPAHFHSTSARTKQKQSFQPCLRAFPLRQGTCSACALTPAEHSYWKSFPSPARAPVAIVPFIGSRCIARSAYTAFHPHSRGSSWRIVVCNPEPNGHTHMRQEQAAQSGRR